MIRFHRVGDVYGITYPDGRDVAAIARMLLCVDLEQLPAILEAMKTQQGERDGFFLLTDDDNDLEMMSEIGKALQDKAAENVTVWKPAPVVQSKDD